MFEGRQVLAVIPARGGSKSIARKNLRPLAGHPLVAWSVAAARESRFVDRVLVSTDDKEIREAALAYGAEAPFLRPAELAQDHTPDRPVFEHAISALEREEGWRADIIVQLRPTSPLRPRGLVDAGVGLLARDHHADSLRAVVPSSQNPYKMWRRRPGDPYLSPLLSDGGPEPFNQPRQALPETLWQTGHLDVLWRRTLVEKATLTGTRVLPLCLPSRYAVDIDTLEQWEFAEWLLRGGLPVVQPALTPCGASGRGETRH